MLPLPSTTSVLLDIETLATTPDTIITEIGLLAFTVPQFDVIAELTIYPSIIDQIADFRRADAATITFHKENGTLPQLIGDDSPSDAIRAITAFIQSHKPRHIWIQGPDFDRPIIENFCAQYHQPLPWKFSRTRDARTAFDLAFPGIQHAPRPHHAIEDCRATLKDLHSALTKLNRLHAA